MTDRRVLSTTMVLRWHAVERCSDTCESVDAERAVCAALTANERGVVPRSIQQVWCLVLVMHRKIDRGLQLDGGCL